MVWYGVVWYGMVWYGMVWKDILLALQMGQGTPLCQTQSRSPCVYAQSAVRYGSDGGHDAFQSATGLHTQAHSTGGVFYTL